MTTLLIGLLGGGTLVQLIQLLIQRRSFGRKTDAEALGGEVEALEKAIATLRNNLDAEVERHDTERRRFESRIAELEGQIANLEEENRRLRNLCNGLSQ